MWLPGPSYLESYDLCQEDTDAGTECLMLPAVSVIPDAAGIDFLWIFFLLMPPSHW